MFARSDAHKNIAVVAVIGLLGTVSTLNLMKNNIPTTFAQPVTTTTNNTQRVITTSQAGDNGIFHIAIFRFRKSTSVMPWRRFARLLLRPGGNQEISAATSTAVLMTRRSSISWNIGLHRLL
jgi:hypothetical protein